MAKGLAALQGDLMKCVSTQSTPQGLTRCALMAAGPGAPTGAGRKGVKGRKYKSGKRGKKPRKYSYSTKKARGRRRKGRSTKARTSKRSRRTSKKR